ncbi:FAD/NAD(P)-binding oxidoreductase [Georgenia sp. MJ173]|uniref:NAD(P)/FAD-dependent oxidoreductase n=1 Tax=Georgenia sunbinii TaxID=3117728 RepID=UPI002F2690A2
MTVHPTARPPVRRVVVVGSGLAGLRTAAELRGQGFDGELTVVSAELLAPYDRPPLSKELLSRPEPLWLAGEGYGELADLADHWLRGHEAVALDADDDGARLEVRAPDDGRTSTLAADAVVVATGARPVRRPTWHGALHLHDAGDAARLREELAPGRRLTVIGAGWIGGELATVASAAGVEVTVLEAAPGPLAHVLGTEVSRLVAPWYPSAGITLCCTALVTATGPEGVQLDDGSRVAADVVVAAAGVRPATAWLGGTLPLTARGAVPVDLAGRVRGGPATVRAVGDVTDRWSPRDGELPGAHWDGALSYPAALVADLLGGDGPAGRQADPAPYVFSTQLGHELTVVGRVPTAGEVVLRGDPASGEGWTALYVAPDDAGEVRLRAGFTVDRPRDVGALRRALSAPEHSALDPVAAADPGLPLRKALR